MRNIQYGKAGLILTSWQGKAAKISFIAPEHNLSFPKNCVEVRETYMRKPPCSPTVCGLSIYSHLL